VKHLTPHQAFDYLQRTPEALFLDVRMEIEYLYVGHPPGVVHLAWYEYPEMQANPLRGTSRA
jgi:rhodanese-related sulfurtransferase